MIHGVNVAELKRQVEHKFAPVPLLAVQALANTYSFEDDEELLLDAATTGAWLTRSGLAAEGVAVSAAEHERLRHFRTVVRTMIEANGAGHAGAVDAAGLGTFVTALGVPLSTGPGGELGVDLEPAAGVDGVIARMLGIIQSSQISGEWGRLKLCASDDCRWAFYDSSRNKGGTWCQMEVCGNRVKNRRYRGRRAGHAHGAGR
jgi:predicted RNA-binding Zn ribbon-like protein